MKFSVDQPPRIARAKELTLGAGTSYVTPTENVLRMSKSDGPRFSLSRVEERILEELPNAEPAEAVSIECDQV